jgi:hypothetical protein
MGNGIYFKIAGWVDLEMPHIIAINFEVNLITHLGVIALFSSFFIFILILFVLYFKNYLEIDLKFKLQKCTQFWKRTTQESFQQSLVEIGSVVSEEKIFF